MRVTDESQEILVLRVTKEAVFSLRKQGHAARSASSSGEADSRTKVPGTDGSLHGLRGKSPEEG